ncbi:cyclodeaminase/cyclohydrolase family protein [Saccharopolyspora sp. 7B]|uniref:cyclodeaminase/cyclohydrolase family protein n=1 Tax=Saccharopolyspora sp. 7B TaxID=2877240 RepID=UPI001CD46555|nr:cyclodeaminase/cyclohydrolase family protein [Saccharopolyspora sp. 7B]MCA1282323.1 cyclodeaminase/cyclohydrolase family protein [Saccharopolyspora sp. 7B]
MRTDSIDTFLQGLASRDPAPGGGATAALHAAQGAALVAMVARFSDGAKYAEHAAEIGAVLAEADELRGLALDLVERDATAFGAVGAAYGLPKDTAEAKSARSRAIAAALAETSRVPVQVIAVADRVVGLAERLRPVGNRNVITDIAAAADAARAAASTSRVNAEVNLPGVAAPPPRDALAAAIAEAADVLHRADETTTAVREQIQR